MCDRYQVGFPRRWLYDRNEAWEDGSYVEYSRESPPKAETSTHMHTRDFCIVVAEDDEILRYCTVHLLKQHGYKVIEARDGLEALEIIEKCNDKIHLLITNHDMPRMSGIELVHQLKQKRGNLMILLISGADHHFTADTDIEVLPKPYNEAVFATTVRNLLRRSEAS